MLKGVKILDLTRLLPGPYATMLLKGMGAEIIKVEDTKQGDYLRWMPPHFKDMNVQFGYLNRGKKSISLNLKEQKGREIFYKLVEKCDAVIEQFRPGVLDKLGVGYEKLKNINPSIVYCAITGYGQNGRLNSVAGHDLNYISLAGILNLNGKGEPVIPPVQIGDLTGGIFAALLVVGALFKAKQTGKGSFLDVSMLETALSFISMHAVTTFLTGEEPERGKMHLGGGIICYNVYKTKDERFITIAALEPKFWKAFVEAVNAPELLEEQLAPAEDGNPSYEKMKKIFMGKELKEWEELFLKIDACGAPVRNFNEVLNCEHLKERGFIKQDVLEKDKTLPVPGLPGLNGRGFNLGTAPHQGEHTMEILKGLGYNSEEILSLEAEGVVKVWEEKRSS